MGWSKNGSSFPYVNVNDYGADPSLSDNSAAFADAWAALGSPANGTFYIPKGASPYKLTSTVDFNCGYTGAGTYRTNANTTGSHVTIICDGTIEAAAGIGTAIFLHAGFNLDVQLNFYGGGQWGTTPDNALRLGDIAGLNYDVAATNFAGTVVYYDSNADSPVAMANGGKIYANDCGRACYYANGNSYGTIDSIWETNSAYGSEFNTMDDITILHYENYTSQTTGASFLATACAAMKIGVIALGNGSTPLVEFSAATVVMVDQLLLDGVGAPANAVGCLITDANTSVTIGKAVTSGSTYAIQTANGAIANIGSHIDSTSTNALYADGQYLSIGNVNYSGATDAAIKLEAGSLDIGSGLIQSANSAQTTNTVINVAGSALLSMRDVLIKNITTAATSYSITCSNAYQVRLSNVTLPKPLYFTNGQFSTATLTSGTAVQNNTFVPLTVTIPVTMNPTTSAAATASVSVGPASTSLTALPSEEIPANGLAGTIRNLTVTVPPYWYYEVNVTNATIGTATTQLQNVS